MTLRAKRMLSVATLVIALFVALFSILGYAMAASLTGSRVAAYIYLATDGVSVFVAAGAVVTLTQLRAKQRSRAI